MSSNAAKLYKRIQEDHEHTQALFRQALQNPQGALQEICRLGKELDLPVTSEEVKDYLASLDDSETKQWLIKARGGL
tara:strand:+ start:312 stop:542 length:231 start_codon:yes stop_codon:yes gene_type:complete